MKRYTFIIITLFSLTACSDSFLDVTPTDRFTQNTYWNTKEQGEAALNATYATLINSNSLFSARNAIYLDALTPNAYQYNADENIISRGLHNAATSTFNGAWNTCYTGIGRANNLLVNIDKVSMDESLKNRYKAEAKFLRALFYFPLWNLFGGAPLITEATNYETQANLPRNSAEELLAQILKDLDEAAANNALPASYSGADKGRVTRGAVQALKARVLLYAGKWEEAAAAAKQVIDTKTYTLFPDYRGLFYLENEGNSEVIFDIQYKFPEFAHSLDVMLDQQLGCAPLPGLVNDYYATDGRPIANSSLYNAAKPYENRDSRLQATVIIPGTTFKGASVTDIQYPSTGYGLKKYTIFKDNEKPTVVPTSGTSELNYILLRYADVLLMYAEAMNEAIGPDASVGGLSVSAAINQVRARAKMPNVPTGLSKEQMREEIRHERRIEFAGEGLYYFDIRRWKQAEKLLNTDVYNIKGNRIDSRSFNANRDYLWPVPSIAIQNNVALTQNLNYGK
ncbi:MAG: RagB/SusD family nutrient uptake outer membrane protein [Arcticibacter sp.]